MIVPKVSGNEYDDVLAERSPSTPASARNTGGLVVHSPNTRSTSSTDSSAATEDRNEYDDLLTDAADQAQRVQRQNLLAATQSIPDEFARTKALSGKSGVPAGVVERNLPAVERRVQLNEYDAILSRASSLASQVREDKDFARLALDDLEHLSLFESISNSFSRGVRALKQTIPTLKVVDRASGLGQLDEVDRQLAAGVAPENIPGDSLGVLADQYRFLTPAERQDARARFGGGLKESLGESAASVGTLEREKREIPQAGVVGRVMRSKTFGEAVRAAGHDPLDFLASIGPESLMQSLPGLIAAIPATAAAGPAGAAAAVGGGSYIADFSSSFLEALSTQGVDIANESAVRAAVQNPDVLAKAIDKARQHATVVAAFDALSAGVASKVPLPKSVLASKPVAREAANMGVQAGIQAGLGAAGEAGGQLNAGDPIRPGEILAEALGEFVGTPAEVASVSVPRIRQAIEGVVSRVTERQETAQRAVQDGQTLATLDTQAAASKLRERSPEAFQAYVQRVTEESGSEVQNLYIDAAAFSEALAQSGIEPGQVAQLSPSIATQLAEADLTHGDLRIPMAEFAARIAGTDVSAALIPHLRTSPEAMSQAEARALPETERERFAQEVETALNAVGEAVQTDTVREAVNQQLKQTGRFTDEVNAAYSTLTSAFYSTMAQRSGTTPEALFQAFPLSIRAESPLASTVFDQSGPTADQPIEGIASGAQTKAVPPAPQGGMRDATYAKPNRGAFDPESNTIALLANADLSTFLHESGHFYLEVLTELASRLDALQAIRHDMDAVLKWFGVPDLATWQALPLEGKREHHEQFARGFESYLFEGRAPNVELQSMFSRFRAWLLNVYKTLRGLNVQLSSEVRGVFDRLLATDEQIEAAESMRSYAPLFDSAEQAGMTPEAFTAYRELHIQATQSAAEELQTRSLRDMKWLANAKSGALKTLQKDAAGKRKALRDEVAAEVNAEPVYAAMRFIQKGEAELAHPTNRQRKALEMAGLIGTKLSLPALKDLYGDAPAAPWRYLAAGKHGLVANEGLHPDLAAELFGFSSGDELVRSILEAPPVNDVIEARTDQRMLERHGDLTDVAAQERAAEAAIHNDVRAKFIAREVDALSKASGRGAALMRAAKAFADVSIAGKRLRDLRPAQFAAAESRAGREAMKAWRGGDTAQAAEHKRAQLLNNRLTKAATEALEEADRSRSYLRRFDRESTRKAIGPEYADQIDQLLERFDLRRAVSDRQLDKRKSLLQWVESQREQGFEPVVDDRLLNEARRQHYRELTVEEFRGLTDAVRNIEHLGRLKQKLLTSRDQRDFAEAVTEAERSIRINASKTLAQEIENDLPRDRAKKLLTGYLVSHRKVSSLLRAMDGHKDDGVLWNLFVRPMNAAGDFEAVEREKAAMGFAALFKPLTKEGGLYRKTFIPEIGTSPTKMGRLAIALNWGNTTNRQRILEGEGWTPAQADAVLRTLTKEDWDFVQGIWDYIDSYWPRIKAKEERVSGIAPEKVEAAPVETPFGTYRGGYYPIKYDPARSSRSEANEAAEVLQQAMQGLHTRATTRRGHTKARTDTVKRPLRKDFGVIFEHVDQVIHDLAWHEWLIDANRLLSAPPIDKAIREHYGPEVLSALRKSHEDIARGETPAQNSFEAAINHLRAGVSIAGMGWNLMTSLMQPLGLTQSMARIGPKWVGRGIARWLGGAARMEKTVEWIHERSDFMRLRAKTMQREISEIRNTVESEGSKLDAVRSTFFYFIAKAQMIADVPTWLGAYEKAIDQGSSEDKAVALADQAVLDSQGGGQIKDLAQIQRGGPLQKLFTNFYSYFNVTYNLTAESVRRTNFKNPLAVGRLAVDFLLLYTLPVVLSVALKESVTNLWGDDDGDDEALAQKLAREQLSYLFGTMVGLREISGVVAGYHGYNGPAGTRFFSELARLTEQVEQGEVDEAMLKALNSVAGILFHYPSGQVQKTVEGVTAISEGDAGPQAVLFGPPTD